MKRKETVKYTTGLNGLRGVMALFIIVIHYGWFPLAQGLPFNGIMENVIYQAQYMVDGFFVLSGFLIVYNYQNRIRNNEITFHMFIKKRLIHVYPMMIFSLACLILFQSIYSLGGGKWFASDIISNNNLCTFLLNIFCLQSLSVVLSSFNAPTWFLSQIIFMYIIFYFIVWRYGKYKKENIVWGGFIVLGLLLAIREYPPLLAFIFNSRAVLGFFSGCIWGEVYKAFDQLNSERVKKYIAVSSLLCLIIIFMLYMKIGNGLFGDIQNAAYIVYSLCIWPLFIFCICNISFLRKIFSCSLLCYIGKISLCTYVMHFPIMVLMEIINKCFGLGWNYSEESICIIYVLMVLVISTLCHFLIQKKAEKLFNI